MTSAIVTATIYPTATCPQDGATPPKDTEHMEAELATVTNGDAAPEGHPNKISSLMGDPEEKSMPPNLETFISGEYLPDNIDVYVTSFSHKICDPHLDSGLWEQFIEQHPVRFVRQYPPRIPTDKGRCLGTGSKPMVSTDRPTTGQLDLRYSKFLGNGNHSFVILAPLTLPSVVSAPSTHGAVAVKLAGRQGSEREMLLNEAKIYNAFPRELQEGSPQAPPIVPKFYGYYVPSLEAFDSYADDDKFRKKERECIRTMLECITPILLLESCGEEIRAMALSSTDREKVFMLLHRLHAASFVQGSFYERNILMQPGPLTLPRTERSFNDPSYRIIDFGRGKCPRVNCESTEYWYFEAEEERKRARRRIGCFDSYQ